MNLFSGLFSEEYLELMHRTYCLQIFEDHDHVHICANKRGHLSMHQCKADVTGFKECGFEWGVEMATPDGQFLTTVEIKNYCRQLGYPEAAVRYMGEIFAGKWRTSERKEARE